SQVPERQVNDIEMEIEFFQECLKSVQQDMTALESKIGNQLAEEELQLFNVYARMLDDDVLGNEVIERIRLGSWAQGALAFVARKHIRAFEAIEDDYLRDRSADIKDLFSRVLLYLQKKKPFTPKYANNSILVSNELTPSMIADVPLSNLKGLVSIKGAGNSHVAILARTMGIPTVMGVTDLPLHLVDGKKIVLDGNKGNVISNPTELLLKDYTEAIIEQDQFIAGLEDLKDFPCETKDKHKVHLWINTGLMSDTIHSVDRCVEGVGLFRTEVPFILSERFPSEKEQALIYRQQLESFAPNLVTMRTLDVGGDKDLPYFPIKEANPFLGWRGIRVTLDHPEIFISQIRAMLRASYKLENLQIMLPMISSVGEVDAAIQLIKRAHRELRQEGLSINFPPIGVMIELPAAVYQARALAKLVDFISVGSNDLTQYLLAVDRNNPRVADLYSAFHPAVLGALNYIVKEVKLAGKPISICGEMAGDPGAAVLLMAMGFDILSMNSAALLKVKSVIRSVTYLSARDLLDSVLEMDDMHAVRKEVDLMLYNSGVDRVLRSSRTN
ncbi:MAG: phosphoenolpyruvate--protein phosphotransferase, partial [Pseudohongiellaceae bacterium]